MSNSGSNKKEPAKKASNSYSLLQKGLNEIEKTKPKTSSSSKKTKDNSSRSLESPEKSKTMTSRDDYSDNRSSHNDAAGDMQDPDVPDRSFGDYYCKLCDSHMNSDAMWEAHVTGKRHIKNVTKGDTETRYEDLPDVESSIKNEIKNVKDPIVGLSYIHEIRRREPNVPPIYNCFLCHASIATVPLVIEHVTSMKHRLNYIKENNPEEYQLIEATNLKKGHMEPLVLEAARQMEQKVGRGTVKVKLEKKKDPAAAWVPRKKPFNLNDDYLDRYEKPYPKNANYEELGPRPDVWKSFEPPRISAHEDRYRAPRDLEEDFMHHSRNRSPHEFRERKRMYSGEDSSLDGYKRSFSTRDRSPSLPRDNYEKRSYTKRDISPNEDFHHFRDRTDYLHSSRKAIMNSKYETTDHRESVGVSYPALSQSFEKSASCLRSVESSSSPIRQPKSLGDVFEYASLLTHEECYKLCYVLLKTLPDVNKISEMMALMRIITEAQKKLKSKLNEDIITALVSYQKGESVTNAANAIPGLDSMPPAASLQNRTDTSQNAATAESFLNSIFKNLSSKPATAQFPMPTSYASTINSQPPALGNSYQTPTANYPSPSSANTYQGASVNSFPNQSGYQFPNTNMPFTPGSVPNNHGLNNANPQPQGFNYSRFPSAASTSSASRNYNYPPRKY